MSNILFLDLDGPAFPDAVMHYHPDNRRPYPGTVDMGQELTYWKMCERFTHLYMQMYETREFEVVISSAWRKYHPNPECFYDLFEQNGLPLNLHSDWRTTIMSGNTYGYYSSGYTAYCTRADEIHDWLMKHTEIKHFAIFDDPQSGISLVKDSTFWNTHYEYMADNIILVDPDVGFGSSQMQKALLTTQKWLK